MTDSKAKKMAEVECEEFYNLMQVYRHTPISESYLVIDNYEAVKEYISKRILASLAAGRRQGEKAATMKQRVKGGDSLDTINWDSVEVEEND